MKGLSMEGTTNNLIVDIQSVIDGVSMGDIGAYISLSIYLIMAISAVSGLLFGLGRGFGKGIIRLITIVISLITAFIIASSVSGWLAGFFAGKTLLEAIAMFSDWVGGFIPGFAITFTEEIENIDGYYDYRAKDERSRKILFRIPYFGVYRGGKYPALVCKGEGYYCRKKTAALVYGRVRRGEV